MTQTITQVAGIDTAKHKLDIALHGQSKRWQIENCVSGWRDLASRLAGAGVNKVGIEATGGYESGVVAYLRGAGFVVLLLQPLQVKNFAKSRLRRAKNDALDAELIAAYTAQAEPRDIAPDARLTGLAGQLTFVEQTEEDIARLKIRLEHIGEPQQRRLYLRDIARLQARRRAELKRIAALLRQHDDLARRLALVLSIPGIGERTALAIVIRMPELGQISREEAAALAGLAPFDNDSGKHRGQRHIAGGRDRLRRSLYAAALPASFRWNAALIDLYRRLMARGKAHQAALIACARKLIVYANTVVQRGTPWIKSPAL
ncbi:IS110 family transposase [Tardiphaga alba]|uniref:IS110 family transposase n=2 Tax=Tardiphaga alba TaxID=340268 RepID=A0ABX8AHD6_9BRAD|nr:IS110 family transposase [Tardiphaga alba]QUS42356.1 IS110 family transposase [Tardiphaga alba]QUS42368.1 IS110 family transposase [Tardiphaga alba]QUS42478.1 IS110 family transposase [Tardiphaga alba]